MQFIYRSCSLPICFCFFFFKFHSFSCMCVCVFLEKISVFFRWLVVLMLSNGTNGLKIEGNVVNLVCNSLVRSHRVRNEMSKNEQFLWPLNGVSFSLFWLHCVRDGSFILLGEMVVKENDGKEKMIWLFAYAFTHHFPNMAIYGFVLLSRIINCVCVYRCFLSKSRSGINLQYHYVCCVQGYSRENVAKQHDN